MPAHETFVGKVTGSLLQLLAPYKPNPTAQNSLTDSLLEVSECTVKQPFSLNCILSDWNSSELCRRFVCA